MNTRWTIAIAALFIAGMAAAPAPAAEKLRALIIDGQNNHDWRACTPVLRWILEDSGRFSVDVSTSPPASPRPPQPPRAPATAQQQAAYEAALAKFKDQKAEHDRTIAEQWKQWRPRFADYAVIVSNYNGEHWPQEVRDSFVKYVSGGGGLVIVHAADNAFGDWPEYNEMIGVGGWGGRNERHGPMVRWRNGRIVHDTTPGGGGTHGNQHEFVVETREPDHPIMRGLPTRWKHATDELYAKLRGPAKNMTVLATAWDDPAQRGTGEHEPILMVISYGQGRVFHTVLGHGPHAMSGLGFQVTLNRGTEWAASGQVTLPAPSADQLPADRAAMRKLGK
jgi:uncharacterized protein